MRRKRRRKKLKALDKYVIFSISVLLIFTAAQMIITALTQVEQSTLITCFFACFGGEVLACALIKSLKLKRGVQDEDSNDYDSYQ